MKWVNLSSYKFLNIQIPNSGFAQYLKCFPTSPLEFAMVLLDSFKSIFTLELPTIYGLTGASTCKQYTLEKFLSVFISRYHVNVEINKGT